MSATRTVRAGALSAGDGLADAARADDDDDLVVHGDSFDSGRAVVVVIRTRPWWGGEPDRKVVRGEDRWSGVPRRGSCLAGLDVTGCPAGEERQRLLGLRAGLGGVEQQRETRVGGQLHRLEAHVEIADDGVT
jgi:hypothetical protein